MKTVIILKKYKISKAIATVCHRTDADKVLGYHKRQRAIELSQKRMTAHLVGILINGTLLIRFTNHVNWHYRTSALTVMQFPLLYSPGNYIQYFVITNKGKECGKEYVCIHMCVCVCA